MNEFQPNVNKLDEAAILLLSIGEEAAAKIMKWLDEATVNNLAAAMARVKRLEQTASQRIVDDFLAQFDDASLQQVDGFEYVGKVLAESLGEHEAARVMEHLERGDAMKPAMDIMRGSHPASIAEQMRSERPQSIALALAHLEAAAGADLLAELPEDVAHEVLGRFAKLDTVHPHVLEELGSMLSEQLVNQGNSQRLAGIGGPQRTAELLQYLDAAIAEQFLTELANADASVANEIREHMFTMEDLVNLDNRSLQTVLREVSNEDLARALRATSTEVVDKVLSNMSSRAAQALREELDTGPRVKRSEAEQAQKTVTSTARRLDSEGKITISRKEDLL